MKNFSFPGQRYFICFFLGSILAGTSVDVPKSQTLLDPKKDHHQKYLFYFALKIDAPEQAEHYFRSIPWSALSADEKDFLQKRKTKDQAFEADIPLH